jgi:hypothetical protein
VLLFNGDALLDAHLKAATEQQKMWRAQAQHQVDGAETALGTMATAHSHDAKLQQRKTGQGEIDV